MHKTLTAALMVAAGPALAAPSIDVHALWFTEVQGSVPGLTVACGGSAVAQGAGRCGDGLSVVTLGTGTVSRSGSMSITNNGGASTGLFLVELDSGPFNPGGSWVGLTIDPGETGSFSSAIALGYPGGSFDTSVGCALPGAVGREPTGNGEVFTPTSCGLRSPDESQHFYYADLAPGGSVTFTGRMTVSDAFDPPTGSVPEPSGLLVLGLGLVGLLGLRHGK